MALILVVEDNSANLKLATLLLEHVGHRVLAAPDAEVGLTLARAEQPDLILMDIQLPGMDGLAATGVLKNDPATAAIPVIALTAMAMKSDAEKSRQAGCDGYITKPLRYQELYAAIDALLARSAGGAWGIAPAHQTPVTAPRPVASVPYVPPSRADALSAGRLILLADDNLINQKLIVRQLGILGYAADAVDNGQLALALWRKGDYALVLTDLHMPEMDGFDLARAIRAAEKHRRIPIVASTASAAEGDIELCRLVGMDDFLGKPFPLAELSRIVEKWLAVSASVVDVRVLEEFVGTDHTIVGEFIAEFRLSAAEIALALTDAVASDSIRAAGEQAHKLKSSARAVGATALGALCAKIEEAGRHERRAELNNLLPAFERELAAVTTFLDDLRHPEQFGTVKS